MATLLKPCARSCNHVLRRYLSVTQRYCVWREEFLTSDETSDSNQSRISGPRRRPESNRGKTEGQKRKQPELKPLGWGSLKYEVLSASDDRLGRTILQSKTKRGRTKRQEIIIEGGPQVKDALLSRGEMKAFYFSGTDVLEKFPLNLLPDNVPLYKVPKMKLNLFTDLAASPGILGIFKMPPEGNALSPPKDPLPITVVCSGFKDPASLGTILRSAAAVGCERVILIKGCCDHWNSKVLRTSGLSPFYTPIISDISWSQLPSLFQQKQTLQPFLVRIEKINQGTIKHYEGSGKALERLEKLEDEEILSEDTVEPEMETKQLAEHGESIDKVKDTLYYDNTHLEEYKQAPITIRSYDDVEYTSGHTVVIIDEDYTLQSKKFLYDNHGQVLYLPISSKLYGLQACMAGSLVLFQACNQYRKLNELKEKEAEI